jgi:hypothetical protein
MAALADGRSQRAYDGDADLQIAKNRSVIFSRATAAADFTPFSSSASMRDLRVAIIAISDAAKKPLAKIKRNMNAASNQTCPRSIECVSYFSAVMGTEENGGDVFSSIKRVSWGTAKFWRWG